MKKNSGFTIVEIIVAFALTMVVVLFLFQIVITLKDAYQNNFVVSNLVLKQDSISNMINNDLNNNNYGTIIDVIFDETTGCYTLTFENTAKRICYNLHENYLSYDDYEFNLVDKSTLDYVNVYKNNENLFIDIAISYKDLDDDYGVKVFYTQTEGMIIETPTCIETCYWYYTETKNTYCATESSTHSCHKYCDEGATNAKNNAGQNCSDNGGSTEACAQAAQTAYSSNYNKCIHSYITNTTTNNVYYQENSVKAEYSCDAPPSSTYTTKEIANSCE